jgi:hypothetical protein
MTEDKAWFGSHTAGASRLDIVEQEGAGIAQAIREHRAATGGEAPVEFHAVYKISDNLVTGEDFSANEFHCPPPRSGLSQEDFFGAFLRRTFGADLRATAAPSEVPSVLRPNRTGFQIVLQEADPQRAKLGLDIQNFEALRLVDPEASQSLLARVNHVVSGLSVQEGRIMGQAEVERDLANLALEYQSEFGIRLHFPYRGTDLEPISKTPLILTSSS